MFETVKKTQSDFPSAKNNQVLTADHYFSRRK